MSSDTPLPVSKKPTILTAQTLIPLGSLIVIGGLIFKIAMHLASISNALDQIKESLDRKVDRTAFAEWQLELKNHNPELKVPTLKKE